MSSAAACDDFKELALEMTWLACERCGSVGPDVNERQCMTAYSDEKLNVKPVLCDLCAQEYLDYWTELWDEYHRSRG
jgi:hypothetical protein